MADAINGMGPFDLFQQVELRALSDEPGEIVMGKVTFPQESEFGGRAQLIEGGHYAKGFEVVSKDGVVRLCFLR